MKRFYPISSEIKSEEKQAVEQQSISQMFGMFRSCQIASLGIIQKPDTLQVQIIHRSDDNLTLHILDRSLLTTSSLDYKRLAKLIILFLFCVEY
jgi:hypothetical protein